MDAPYRRPCRCDPGASQRATPCLKRRSSELDQRQLNQTLALKPETSEPLPMSAEHLQFHHTKSFEALLEAEHSMPKPLHAIRLRLHVPASP